MKNKVKMRLIVQEGRREQRDERGERQRAEEMMKR